MFCIKTFNKNYYFQKDEAIILFDDPNMAAVFAQKFFQYAVSKVMQTREHELIFDVIETQNNAAVIEVDFYLDKVKTVHISELS